MVGEGNGFGEFVQLLRSEHGIDVRDDLFGAMGGELTLAIDGPLFPTPAWKMVMEVYDPARLQFAIEQTVAEANQAIQIGGEPTLELTRHGSGDRAVYSLVSSAMEAHYTFVEGYVVIAPSRPLVDRALRFHASGYSIVDSPKFSRLMPDDGRNNFSALVYQDLSSFIQTVAENLADGALTEEQQGTLDAVKSNTEPTLGFAYGDPDRITLAASSQGDMLSTMVMRMLGVKDPISWEALLAGGLEGLGS